MAPIVKWSGTLTVRGDIKIQFEKSGPCFPSSLSLLSRPQTTVYFSWDRDGGQATLQPTLGPPAWENMCVSDGRYRPHTIQQHQRPEPRETQTTNALSVNTIPGGLLLVVTSHRSTEEKSMLVRLFFININILSHFFTAFSADTKHVCQNPSL